MGYIWPSRDNILIRISRGIREMLFRDFTRIKLEKKGRHLNLDLSEFIVLFH